MRATGLTVIFLLTLSFAAPLQMGPAPGGAKERTSIFTLDVCSSSANFVHSGPLMPALAEGAAVNHIPGFSTTFPVEPLPASFIMAFEKELPPEPV